MKEGGRGQQSWRVGPGNNDALLSRRLLKPSKDGVWSDRAGYLLTTDGIIC